jgi:hypothetical protein
LSPRDRLHPCAAEECTREISRGLLMCLSHWHMVPAPLQRAVTRGYRTVRRTKALSDLRVYRAAADQAIAAVREKEIKRQMKRDSMGDTLQLE